MDDIIYNTDPLGIAWPIVGHYNCIVGRIRCCISINPVTLRYGKIINGLLRIHVSDRVVIQTGSLNLELFGAITLAVL